MTQNLILIYHRTIVNSMTIIWLIVINVVGLNII